MSTIKETNDKKFQLLFEHMVSGFAYHKIITDDAGTPVDYEFIDVNKSFEKLTGLKRENVIGRRATKVIPGIEKSDFDWITTYGNVALSGVPMEFEQYSEPLKKWFRISAYCPQEKYFAVTFADISEQKKLKASLNESKERFQLLYENAPLPYQSLDNEGNIIDVNKSWLETMGGYRKKEVIGKSFGDFLLVERQAHFKDNFYRVKDISEILGVEFEMIKKDGSVMLVHFNGNIFYDKDGYFQQTLCILQDITDKRALEEKIRESEVEWEKTFNAMSDIVTVQDSEFRIKKANTAALSALGLSRDEIINHYCYDLFQDLKEPCSYCPLLETQKTFKPYKKEIYNEKFGKTFQVSADPLVDSEGKLQSITHVARDITDLKQLETSLKASNEFSTNLLENSPNPIIAINPDSSIKFVNPALEKLTCFSSDELVGTKIPYPFWREGMIDKIIDDIKEAMRRGAQAVEEPFQKKNGDHIWVEITSTPIFKEGRLIYYLANWTDITNRKQMEQEKDKLLAVLQKTLNEINTLKGIIPICSHCKKIRNDEGSWDQLEAYISRHSEAQFSHGICEVCLKKHYPELDDDQ